MANIKKPEKEKSKHRCVSLSDVELKEIYKLTGIKSLTQSIRYLLQKLEQSGNK